MSRLKNRLARLITSLALITVPLVAYGFKPIGNPLTGGSQKHAGGGPELFPRFALLLMEFLGVIFLAAIIYGGVLWMVSSGNSERVEKGKGILIWSTIGMIVVAFAYVIVKFIISAIIEGGEPFSQ